MTVRLIGSCSAVAEKLSVCLATAVAVTFLWVSAMRERILGRPLAVAQQNGIGGSIRSMRRFAPHLTSEQSSISAGEVEVYLRQHRHNAVSLSSPHRLPHKP